MAGGLAYSGYALVNSWFEDMPDYTDETAYETALPTMVYASDGTTLLARLEIEYREPVTLNQVSQSAIDATLAIEDARFYEHSGLDLMGIGRALASNLSGGSFQGGSTITQQ